MKIEAVLFDADGVVQYQAMGWREAFQKVLADEQRSHVDEFMKDVFAVEEPALIGKDGFKDALAVVLKDWGCAGSVEDALRAWTMIDVYTDVIEAIQGLRKSGVRCCLATNQQSHRALHMSRTLRFNELFDREFYSCEMGSMKPASEYFWRIIHELKLPANKMAFLDDHEINVAAARKAGIHAATYEGKTGVPVLREILSGFGIGML